jgi:uncharacterized protein (TIGR03086 family)
MTRTDQNPADLYIAAMDATQRYVAGVPSDKWTNPTPCDEWDVRDVVSHVVSGNLWLGELFNGKTIEEVGDVFEGDVLGDDPVGAYKRSVEIAKAAVSAPGAMDATTHLSFGDVPGSEYASQMFLDLLIHGWDIAAGSGQDRTLNADLVRACYPVAEKMTSVARETGAYGDDLGVTDESDLQTKLLGLLGRSANWPD